MNTLTASFLIFGYVAYSTSGHGMLLEPPNRSSLWRYNSLAVANYNDNQNFCGGFSVQWYSFDGKCGVCGDKYDDAHPQANENTGKYGQGIVTKEYTAGSLINVQVSLTSNHKGFFSFSLCVLNNPNLPESGEDCFQTLGFANGKTQYNLSGSEKNITTQIQLPKGLTCKRCVLRWHYSTGNNWGVCADGTGAIGCGPQETFRSCSDIAIH